MSQWQKGFKEVSVINNEMDKQNLFYAYDPIIGKRVVHVLLGNGKMVSLVTGHKFNYKLPKH